MHGAYHHCPSIGNYHHQFFSLSGKNARLTPNDMYIFDIQFDLMQKVTLNTGTIKIAEFSMSFGPPSSENFAIFIGMGVRPLLEKIILF